ncbi:MAG: type II toxin-antitoxin system ParD family antitoxin [Alphaproteobacteria bacterium]|nr:type II toxin-antitoxin system ParD family antitoxin [Alphaproteobacteria bacterium]
MSVVEKRSISLPAELATVIDQAVASGEFGNASEVVREALRQWKERRDLHGLTVEEVRLLWDQGIASGERQAFPDSFVELIKRRGRERLD